MLIKKNPQLALYQGLVQAELRKILKEVGVINGVDGKIGAKGDQGEKGEPGSPGKNGDIGRTGDRGPRGFTGEMGQRGLPGLNGAPGLNGKNAPIVDLTPIKDELTALIPTKDNILVSILKDPRLRLLLHGGGSSSSASGITELTATGAVDGNNASFTFISKPKYILNDGVKLKENAGWTFAGLTATLSVPPQYSCWGES